MILPDNGAQVRRGGGVSGGSAKSPSFTFFLKPSLRRSKGIRRMFSDKAADVSADASADAPAIIIYY